MSKYAIKRAAWCEHEYKHCPSGCPIETAENRLREAHRRWHDCADSYNSPEDFRDGLNSAIQALRNVTFALQSVKSEIDGFESWYAEEQDLMKADPVLRWIVASRNTIVKQDDLKTSSQLKVTVVPSYDAEAASVADEQMAWSELPHAKPGAVVDTTLDVPVELTIEEVLAELTHVDLPMSIRQEATVLFEHRWVDEKMSSYELLALLAHSYGHLNSLLTRCHELLNMRRVRIPIPESDKENRVEAFEELEGLSINERLPCMSSTRQYRITRIRLADGSEVKEFKNWHVEYDAAVAKEAVESGIYGVQPEFDHDAVGEMQTDTQLGVLVATYAEIARGILRSGQDHGWFSYFFRKGRMAGALVHATIDKQGKHAIASEISRKALELGADTVLMIGEAWTSKMEQTPDGAYVPPSLHPEKTEVLVVDAVSKSGATAGGILSFHTLAGEPPHREVEIGEFTTQSSASNILSPTRAAWGISALAGAAFWRAQTKAR